MKRERGNILFLILLAVILFAALSYAVTSSLRGGGTDASNEKVQTQAAAILQHANQISAAITRMRLANNCTPNQISFAYDSNNDGVVNSSDRYHNASAPGTNKCHVFNPAGGGATPSIPDPKWLVSSNSGSDLYGYWNYTGEEAIDNIGTTCTGESCKELMARVIFLKKDLCLAINNALGITNNNGEPPTNTSIRAHLSGLFNGSYVASAATMTASNGLPELAGKTTGCTRTQQLSGASFPNTYTFYHVLIER